MSSALRTVLVVAMTSLAVLSSAVLGAVRPGPSSTVSDVPPAPGPEAGGAACVTGAGPLRTVADLVLVAAPGAPPAADVPARGIVLRLGGDAGGDVERSALGPLSPGALTRSEYELATDGWLWTGWADRPILAWQEWSTPGAPGQPGGTVASTCLTVDSRIQTVLGLTTAGGDEALLRLANPFSADATFAVSLVTPTEVLDPVALRNVSVPGGTRVTVRLNDHAPEQADLAAVVTVGAGRLAVEGLQRSVAAIGGVDGLTSVPPVLGPSVAWTVPWLPTGPDVDGAVWILNPSSRDVVVEVAVHTPEGATVPERDAVFDIGPGGLRRIDVSEVSSDARRVLGFTFRSQTTGVLVGAGARFRAEEPSRTGLVRFAASPGPDGLWAVAGVTDADRQTVLHIVNLSEEPVAPDITLTTLPAPASSGPPEEGEEPDGALPPTDADADADGNGIDDPGAQDAPPDPEPTTVALSSPTIAPGAVGRIVLPLDGAGAWSAFVSGGPGLVVARTTLGDAVLGPVAVGATPSRAWRTVDPTRSGRVRPGWVTDLGTVADLRPIRPDVVTEAG